MRKVCTALAAPTALALGGCAYGDYGYLGYGTAMSVPIGPVGRGATGTRAATVNWSEFHRRYR